MTETSDRYRRVAAAFTDRVAAVDDNAWDRPTPCADWVARDVIRHLGMVGRGVLGRAGVEVPEGPSVDTDPMGAWTTVRDAMQAALDDPSVAAVECDMPMGRGTLEQAVGVFGIGDLLVHTWDLSRAVGLDEHLDESEVARLFAVMEPMDEMMRGGTAFGPRVAVPDDADAQTKMLAFSGRHV